MKKSELTEEIVINWWLEKYHGTNLNKVLEEHPEWKDDPHKHTRDFYNSYKVTEEQHNEWREWLIKTLMKLWKFSRKYVEKSMWVIYLNTAPTVEFEHSQNKE